MEVMRRYLDRDFVEPRMIRTKYTLSDYINNRLCLVIVTKWQLIVTPILEENDRMHVRS